VNKRVVNHDSIDSNVGSKTHHVPKIDMRKFDSMGHINNNMGVIGAQQYK